MMKNHIFISHSSKDDDFVKNLCKGLGFQGLEHWADSQRMAGGDELAPKVKNGGIEDRPLKTEIRIIAFAPKRKTCDVQRI